MTAAAAATTAETSPVERGLIDLALLLHQLDRRDLAARASAAVARLRRTATIVCVVGEFKHGKSSLVNGLLGVTVCPVDDDLATSAITLIRFGDQPEAIARGRADDGSTTNEPVQLSQLNEWVSELGNPRNEKRIERVEVRLRSPVLEQGLVLVDTPGMGGLGAGHAAATLAFLPFADGLIFVSDASAELGSPEIEFLQRAIELCPTVVFAQTKIDLYPAWERIRELNRAHLAALELDIPIVPVSSHVRREALARGDPGLNERSRFPALLTALVDQVVEPAKSDVAERSSMEGLGLVALVQSSLDAERTVLADQSGLGQVLSDLDAATQRLEHLKGPGASWSVLVGDRMADLSNSVMFRFRSTIRSISRQMDERIEQLSRGDAWDNAVRELQTDVAEAVTEAFAALQRGHQDIRIEVLELLGAEESIAVASTRIPAIELSALWPTTSVDDSRTGRKRALDTSLTGAKGAQGGILMFGIMSQFLPGAAAVLIAMNPVLLGIGAVFGGMGLAEDRRRRVQQRRQAARTQVRQFLEDAQFEVTNQLTVLVREIQRDLRDESSARLSDLQRTYAQIARRAREDSQRTEQARQQRSAEIDETIAKLKQIERVLRKDTS